jgi:hypothetical protein
MFSSTRYYQKPDKIRASSPFFRPLNTGALVLSTLVALLLVDAIGRVRSAKDSAPGKSTKSEVVIDPGQALPPLTAPPFVDRMINAVKDAFSDPSLTAYANEQGFDLPDSRATSLPKTSGQPSASLRSLSTQSTSTQSTKSAPGY